MRRALLIALAALLLAPTAVQAAVPPPGAGLLVGYVANDADWLIVNGEVVPVRGHWFACLQPVGAQVLRLYIPGYGYRTVAVTIRRGTATVVNALPLALAG
jgi:hypothetical protein